MDKMILAAPEIGAMSYMMSKEQNLGQNGHWHPHIMFHLSRTDAAGWGANLAGSPVFEYPAQDKEPEPETTFFRHRRTLVGWLAAET